MLLHDQVVKAAHTVLSVSEAQLCHPEKCEQNGVLWDCIAELHASYQDGLQNRTWLSLTRLREASLWFTTASRWLTKQDQPLLPWLSLTSRNIDRCCGGCD